MVQPLQAFVRTYELLTSVEGIQFSSEGDLDSFYIADPRSPAHTSSKALSWRIGRHVEDLENWILKDPANKAFGALRTCSVDGQTLLQQQSNEVQPIDGPGQRETASLTRDHPSAISFRIAEIKSTVDVALINYLLSQNFQSLSSRDAQKIPALNKLYNLLDIIPRKLLLKLDYQPEITTPSDQLVGEDIKDDLEALPHGLLRDLCAKLESVNSTTSRDGPSHRYLDVKINNQSRVHLGDLHYHSVQADSISTEAESPLIVLSNVIQDAQKRFCDQLLFTAYEARYLAIVDSHSNTFDWIFQSTYIRAQDKQSFSQWLMDQRTARGIFWIRGKAGSGKSTMTKHLVNWQTKVCAQDSSLQKRKTVMASHYFWELGTLLQKSIQGCLRTLLSRLAAQVPQQILATLPADIWRESLFNVADKHLPRWYEDRQRLQELFAIFVRTMAKRHSVLLFIDGLDECNATAEEILAFLGFLKELSLTENIRLCLTSRPENIFIQELGNYDHIRLEDLNRGDIRKYAFDKLSASQQFRALEAHEQASANAIADLISSKSSGVFFWVYLAVRDLLDTIRNGGSHRQVLKRLDEMPKELDDYFQLMLRRVQPQLRRESSTLLQIMLYLVQDHPGRRYQDTIDVLDISRFVAQADFALMEDYSGNDIPEIESMQHIHHCASSFVNSRSMGLLELIKQTMRYRDQVGFLHRTVVEFLSTSGAQRILLEYTNGPFDAKLWYANSHIARLRCTKYYCAMWKVGFGEDIHSFKRSFNFVCDEMRTGCLASDERAHLTQKVVERSLSTPADLFHNEEDEYLQLTAHSCLNQDISGMMRSNCMVGDKFLVLAGALNGVAFLRNNLDAQFLRRKTGLSLLDYVLFADGDMCFFGSEWSGALKFILQQGEDPNRISFHGSSPWLRFLLCRVLLSSQYRNIVEMGFLDAVETLLWFGASECFTLDELRAGYEAIRAFGKGPDNAGRARLREIFRDTTTEASETNSDPDRSRVIHIRELFRRMPYLDADDLQNIESSLLRSQDRRATAQLRNTPRSSSTVRLSVLPIKAQGLRREIMSKSASSVCVSTVVATGRDITKPSSLK